MPIVINKESEASIWLIIKSRLLCYGGYDIAGILYFLSNIPILIFAYKVLGRGLAMRTIVCTVSYSVFYSLIPIPVQPIVDDCI